MLNKCDELRKKFKLINYAQALNDLRNVVHECFGMKLLPSYKDSIEKFQKSYELLNLPVTPKIHAIIFRISEFCDVMGKSLGPFSEQSFESSHHDYKEIAQRFKVKSCNPNYSKKLLESVVSYNSRHV